MAELDYRWINEHTKNPQKMIADAEEYYHTHIKNLAEKIARDLNIKIVLLSGPSGSGKTTTANLLADAVRALGKNCIVVSLDDFYRDAHDPEYPRLENGERDYECPEALKLSEIEKTLRAAAEGRTFEIPKHDFKTASKVGSKKYGADFDGTLIIEGLHALNPKIQDPLPRAKILKLFVSVSTNINDGGERILSGRKLRFVRRMVRDSIYRATDAEKTLVMWKNVLAAEDVYLYPYKSTADIAFNTFHSFEPCVMAPFAKRLISKELEENSPYAKTVIEALRKIEAIDSHLVPENSLIREFIPGGIYEELY